MANTTQFLLTKYYGFGINPENKNFLSSHDGTYDPSKFKRTFESLDSTELETPEKVSGQGTNAEFIKNEANIANAEISTGNPIARSSRAIPDDDVIDNVDNEEDIAHGEYETLVQIGTPQDERPTDDENKEQEETDIILSPGIQKNEEREELIGNDSTLGPSDDALPDNVSEISSIPTKKSKLKNQLSVVSSTVSLPPASQAPKKLPACNGIFLDLTNLSLNEFPINYLTDMTNLRMLYLENNSLTILPDELFTSLNLLQWLDVRNNKLTVLPSTIKYHSCLETILLEGNHFEKLSLELCSLPNLKAIQTSHNPLIFPPADILALGFAATIHFLRIEWNKTHPDEVIEPPERSRKPKPSAIIRSDPTIMRTSSKNSGIVRSWSTVRTKDTREGMSVRERSWNYRPGNRCKNRGACEELEMRLLWIAKVKEMLTKQASTLQRIKDRDALCNWRRDRRSYEKSLIKAANRTEDDIPFGIDLEDIGGLFTKRVKIPTHKVNFKRREIDPQSNINENMTEVYNSLKHLQETRKSEILSPRTEKKLLENEIKKLSELQEKIQNLLRYNEMATVPFDGSVMLPELKPYKPPPSIIV